MAAPAAVAAVFILFNRAIFTAYVIPFPFEIIDMAGCAIRRVLIPAIVYGLVVIAVTRSTAEVSTVISWIFTGCRVGVIDSRPTLSRVAVDTLRVSDEVVVATLRLAADRNHTIMAGFAATIDALMIEGASGKGRCGMAERAISGYSDMSKRRRSKAAVDMADTKVLQGWQVIGGLEQFRTVREKLILMTAAATLIDT